MSRSLTVSIANPHVRVVRARDPDQLWLAAGLDAADEEKLRNRGGRAGGDGCAIEAQLCRERGDVCIIRLEFADERVTRIAAWRGITAGYDLFYHCTADGRAVLADHFRNILSALPVSERATDDDAICDHFLFRTMLGGNTHCRAVKRLGRGERLEVDRREPGVRTDRFDHAGGILKAGGIEDYLDRVDEALESVIARAGKAPRVAALFSGGIDSTLIHTYLPSTVPALYHELPSHEAGFEAEYAQRAADLLKIPFERHSLAQYDFLALLENAVDATALPPPHLQYLLFQQPLALGYDWLITGERADALFGLELRRAVMAAPFASGAGDRALIVAERLLPRRAKRLGRIRGAARGLRSAAACLEGFGAQFGVSPQRREIEEVFGSDAVKRRLQARLDLVGAIVPGVVSGLNPGEGAGSRFHQHLDLGQMVDYFSEEMLSSLRHLGHAYGASFASPFSARPVLDAALSIPPAQRYVKGLETKYLLKRLLHRRLPAYPVGQRKGYGGLTFPDLYPNGPLAGVWERYPVPEAFATENYRTLLESASQATWNLITLAAWQARIQNNPGLEAIAGSRSFEWQLGG